MPKKSPFAGKTVEEVFALEALHYIVVAGSEVFYLNGKWIFDQKTAIRCRDRILRGLVKLLETGTKKEQRHARFLIDTIRIEPFRIH